MTIYVIKFLHVLFMIIWVGNLLSLTRLLGFQSKLKRDAQLQVAPNYLRMYCFVGLPSMVLTIIFGIILLINKPEVFKGGWFHMKLTLVIFLILVDLTCGKWIRKLTIHEERSKGVKYKMLHGVCGLLLIGILAAIYIVKNAS